MRANQPSQVESYQVIVLGGGKGGKTMAIELGQREEGIEIQLGCSVERVEKEGDGIAEFFRSATGSKALGNPSEQGYESNIC